MADIHEVGRIIGSPGFPPAGPITPEILLRRTPGGEVFTAVNPRTLSPESFLSLDGYMQQTSLLSLLKSKDLAKINDLRPDFKVNDAPTQDELTMGFLVREINKRGSPIVVPSRATPDSLFAQIYALGYPVGKKELAEILERERKRTQIEFPNSLFAPAESIGNFTAGRRYFLNLLDSVRKDDLAGAPDNYSRAYFKPVEPQEVDTKDEDKEKAKQKREKAQRMWDALDAYDQTSDLLAGAYFF